MKKKWPEQYPELTEDDDIYRCETCDVYYVSTISRAPKNEHTHINEVAVRLSTLEKFGIIDNDIRVFRRAK